VLRTRVNGSKPVYTSEITQEDAAVWRNMMVRTYQMVDIEGIREDDGLGYAVMITGPPQVPKQKRKWKRNFEGHSKSSNNNNDSKASNSSTGKDSEGEWDIIATTTYNVS
jgi:hypothetical protein